MEIAVEAASHYFKFESQVLSAEDAFNRATLAEFQGRLVSVEIDIATEFYEEAFLDLGIARKRIKTMLRSVRKAGCDLAFEKALEERFTEAGVNGFPRISSDSSKITTLRNALSVQKREFQALKGYLSDAIDAAGSLKGEIEKGLFVATLLGEPNKLKSAKGDLEYGKRAVTALLAATTKATAVALEDVFPLGSELLLESKERTETIDVCHGEFSQSDQRSKSSTLTGRPEEVRSHLAHGDTLGSCT